MKFLPSALISLIILALISFFFLREARWPGSKPDDTRMTENVPTADIKPDDTPPDVKAANDQEPIIADFASVYNEKRGMKLIETLKSEGYHRFAELLETTKVYQNLNSEFPFTCFAPADTAFDENAFEKMKAASENEELVNLVKYHFINAKLTHEIIMKSRRELTLNGQFMVFWVSKGEIRCNDHSKITKKDIATFGGIIQGVSEIISAEAKGAIP